MDRGDNNRAVGVGVGILLMLLSLPINWFTLKYTHTGFDSSWGIPSQSVPVTGFNGSVSLFHLSLPIWLFVAVGVLALLFSLLNQRRITSLPRLVLIVPSMISAAYIGTTLWLPIASDDVTIGIGTLLALAGFSLGVFSGFSAFRRTQTTSFGARFVSSASRRRI